MFSIRDFLSEINQGGVAYQSNFVVYTTRPGSKPSDSYDLTFRCEATDLPGRNIQTTENATIYGVPIKIAYAANYAEIPMAVILSEDYREKEFFEAWQDKMVGNHRNGEMSQSMFDLGYYKDYIGTFQIRCFSPTGELTYSLSLRDAYPVSIGPVNLSWDQGNSIAKLPISIAYRFYTNDEI